MIAIIMVSTVYLSFCLETKILDLKINNKTNEFIQIINEECTTMNGIFKNMESSWNYSLVYILYGFVISVDIILAILAIYLISHIIKKINRNKRIDNLLTKNDKNDKKSKKSKKVKKNKDGYTPLTTIDKEREKEKDQLLNHNEVYYNQLYPGINGQIYVPPTMIPSSNGAYELKEIEIKREQENNDRLYAERMQKELNSIV